MRRSSTSFLFAATFGSLSALPALADGVPNYRTGVSPYVGAAPAPYAGVSPYGVATPVPAPIPVPFEEAAWYFRTDFAAGFGSQPSVTTFGAPYGSGTANIGLNSSWLGNGGFEPSFTGAVGVGYVWGPHVRTDLTVDIHSIMNANFNGAQFYSNGATTQYLTVQDKTSFMATILLLNAYWDFRTGTPFSPYIGGGLGFSVDQLTQNIAVSDSGANGAGTVGNRSTQIKFAGAAMAGLTYDINTFISLDVGYRFLHFGGSDVDSTIYGGSQKIEIGDVNEHQIRAGFRFYVN
jgi:opacity protein-like surface antigen